MVFYQLVCDERIDKSWIHKYGDCWSTGRIDVSRFGIDHLFDEEIYVPIMHNHDWKCFGNWLSELRSSDILSLEELIEEYEKEFGKITWLEHEYR